VKQVLLAGGAAGLVTFFLLAVSDAVFFAVNGVPPGLKMLPNPGRQALVMLGLSLAHGLILAAFLRALGPAAGIGSTALRGLVLGLVCGLILARPNVEGMLLFDRSFIPLKYTAYWTIEYLAGYAAAGAVAGLLL